MVLITFAPAGKPRPEEASWKNEIVGSALAEKDPKLAVPLMWWDPVEVNV